jgi:hypothetical protein
MNHEWMRGQAKDSVEHVDLLEWRVGGTPLEIHDLERRAVQPYPGLWIFDTWPQRSHHSVLEPFRVGWCY